MWVILAGFLHKHWIGGLFQTSKILWSVHTWDSKRRPQIYFCKSTSTVYQKCYSVVSLSLSLKHTMIFCSCTLVEHTRTWERKIWSCMLKQFFVTFQVHRGWNFGGGPLLERRWSTDQWIPERTKEEQVKRKLLPTPFDGTLIGTGIALPILRTELNCLWQAWGRVTYEMLLKIYLLLSISSEVKFTFKWYIFRTRAKSHRLSFSF